MIPYQRAHILRLIEATNDLWCQPDSICHACHHTDGPLNCLFCYCPLYDLTDCPGQPIWLPNGIKDCSGCTWPHQTENIMALLGGIGHGGPK